MDRARAAGYIDNNYTQNQLRLKKRQDHLDRLKKIMNRKPGSSVTLDNTAPVVQQATAEDPRKRAKKGLFSVVIERENKVLLQRISAILTEPARDTVKEYDAMKKLVVPKSQGKARIYDQYMEKQRNEKFFASLKNQKPVYRVKDWENSYKVQKYNQRFMREVKYQRPKNFVDPFAPKPETEASPNKRTSKDKSEGNLDGSPGGESAPASSSAHVHRVRHIRASGQAQAHRKGAATSPSSASSPGGGAGRRNRPPHNGNNLENSAGSRNRLSGPHSHSGHSRHDGAHGGNQGDYHDNEYEGEDYDQYYGEDGYEDEDYEEGEGDEEFKELLAEARRDIRISEEVAHGKIAHNRAGHHPWSSGSSLNSAAAEVKLVVTAAVADIRCWLVNSEAIVISVVVQEEDRNLEAEAEISIEDLAVLRGEDPSLLGSATTRSMDDGGGGGISIDGNEHHPLQPEGSVYSLAFDLPTLQQIAAEMVSHVELRVDLDSGARLILNLVSEEEETPAEDAAFATDSLGVEMMNAAAAATGTRSGNAAGAGSSGGGTGQHSAGKSALHGPAAGIAAHPLETQSLVSEEELGDMLIDDNKMVILSTGARLPVHFESQVISSSVANLGSLIDAAKIKSRLDHVYALVRVVSTEDDQLAVAVHVMNDTITQFKRFARAAVVKGSILKISTSLPSVIHADPELVFTFAQNLVKDLKIVHSNRTGKNILSIESS